MCLPLWLCPFVCPWTLLSLVASGKKSDIALGLYLVRGDNVVLLGEIDEAKEAAMGLEEADLEDVRDAEEKAAKVEWDFEKLERS